MRSISVFKTAAMAGLMAFAVSPLAFAQTQCEEDTCGEGYTCVENSYESCEWVCADSTDGAGECYTTNCQTVDSAYCERSACEADADCGDSMVCKTFTATCGNVATPACPPGEECDIPEPMPCEATEYSQCTPRSELPCEADSDCGEGYTCEPSTVCTCGGMTAPGTEPGGGSEGSGGGSGTSTGSAGLVAPPPTSTATPPGAPATPTASTGGGSAPLPPSDCSCEPSGTNYCQMKTIACETNDDCPTDWSCIESPGACWADSEGNTGCSEGSSQCYPPSMGGGDPSMPTGPSPGGPISTPEDGSGSGEDDGDVGGEPVPEAPPTPGNGNGGHHGGHHSNPFHQLFPLWGCSVDHVVGTSSSSSPWAVFAVGLGAALLRRRRR